MERSQRLSITGEDGAIVMSLQVPHMPRVQSAPNMETAASSSEQAQEDEGQIKRKHRSNDVRFEDKQESKDVKTENETPPTKMEMTKKELINAYSLHIFVLLIFIITVLSVSLSWYYRNLSIRMLKSTQKVFFDPRSRKLSLTDPSDTVTVEGHLGLDMPRWQLPLHCPLVVGQDPSMRSCEWKNNAVLTIDHFGDQHVQCYNVTWKSRHPKHVPYDCFYLKGSEWYGPSNQSESVWPIRGNFTFKPSNQKLDNNGMFSSVADFYWISSSGVALWVHEDDPVHLRWNQTEDDSLCLLSNYTGSLHYQQSSPMLRYTLCNGIDPVRTHLFMQSVLPSKYDLSFPPDSVFRGYFWSAKGIMGRKTNVSQDDVIDLMRKARNVSTSSSSLRDHVKISLDTDWQQGEGDLAFDLDLFPNVTAMMDTLESDQTQMTLTVSPHVTFTSNNFDEGIVSHLFVLGAGDHVTGLVGFKGGVAALINVMEDNVKNWLKEKVEALMSHSVTTSLRLSYNNAPWLPFQPHFNTPKVTSDDYRQRIVEVLSDLSHTLIAEHTGHTRHVTQLIPVKSRIQYSSYYDRNCIHDTIATALTVGMMGYPFVIADGLESSASEEEDKDVFSKIPDRELYIRWLQLAAFFPASQITTAPWRYDAEVISMATNFSNLHDTEVLPVLQSPSLRQEVVDGMPILRPVWWLDPTNQSLHNRKINDEFLIGKSLLVAPVLCTGIRKRDIYVPRGVWEDIHLEKVIVGPKTLRNYPVPLYHIAVFKRRETVM